jgi:hypothetical protein
LLGQAVLQGAEPHSQRFFAACKAADFGEQLKLFDRYFSGFLKMEFFHEKEDHCFL